LGIVRKRLLLVLAGGLRSIACKLLATAVVDMIVPFGAGGDRAIDLRF
jgi:hypothetical protein